MLQPFQPWIETTLCRDCDYVAKRRREMILSLYYLLYRFMWVSDVIIYLSIDTHFLLFFKYYVWREKRKHRRSFVA